LISILTVTLKRKKKREKKKGGRREIFDDLTDEMD